MSGRMRVMAGKAAHVAADVLCCPVALRLPGLRGILQAG
ncbi:hypothetical protein CKO_02561 [Citrobacter koseri ATCC BAA-895]|uniref:Uncharacterized protein n=1 Tax=Citrobacter koseri (strain ATCC BAA-895 / CDC 4225-83 / SGSC4696) TaxID=290338 RepID=A8AJK7_CITK8|nr:hypothetical protein CKO_02561 [Citrobacter koseri ATCC BAA-895]